MKNKKIVGHYKLAHVDYFVQCIINQQGYFEGFLTGQDNKEIKKKAKILKFKPFGYMIGMKKRKNEEEDI